MRHVHALIVSRVTFISTLSASVLIYASEAVGCRTSRLPPDQLQLQYQEQLVGQGWLATGLTLAQAQHLVLEKLSVKMCPPSSSYLPIARPTVGWWNERQKFRYEGSKPEINKGGEESRNRL